MRPAGRLGEVATARAFARLGAMIALGWLLLAADGAAAQAGAGCRARIDGTEVRVWIAGTWRPLDPGPLPAGAAKIATGSAARVEIACDGGLVVTIGVSCEINIDALVQPPSTGALVLQLVRGIVGVVLPPGAARPVETRTPLALAAARGTAWVAAHDGALTSAFFAREGRVLVVAPGGEALLTAGEGVDVVAGELRPVVRWGAPRVQATIEALGFDWR